MPHDLKMLEGWLNRNFSSVIWDMRGNIITFLGIFEVF